MNEQYIARCVKRIMSKCDMPYMWCSDMNQDIYKSEVIDKAIKAGILFDVMHVFGKVDHDGNVVPTYCASGVYETMTGKGTTRIDSACKS